MNRKDFLKNISAISTLALLPKMVLPQPQIKKQQFHFIGLGGGGSNALLAFYNCNLKGTYTVISSMYNSKLLSDKKIKHFTWKDEPADTQNWNKLKQQLQQESSNISNAEEYFVLLVGLGGLTGSTLAMAIHRLLKNENKKHTIICTVPFPFEGPRNTMIAHQFIKNTQSNPNFKYVFADNLRIKYPGLKMIDAMKTLDNEMLEVWFNEMNRV